MQPFLGQEQPVRLPGAAALQRAGRQELVQQAVDLMASAKACHDELESYYRAAVDFEAVEQITHDCARRIGLET